MTKQFIPLFIILTALGCGKESFQSKPTLSIKSVSGTRVPAGSDLQVTMQLTDKEGDFVDTIWVKKTTTRCVQSNFIDSFLYRIPTETPRTRNFSADVIVTFSYGVELQPRCPRNDTATFSFWMKDEKGNISDTAKTQQIIIAR
ncbi:MAG: hypothetical protein RLY85_2302 [Bacteroidota bacterium]|jgi:hypothetical protein